MEEKRTGVGIPETAGPSSKGQELPGQLTAGKGEVFSDYDTSVVDSDHAVGLASSEASGDEAMDLEHMDIPIEPVEAALPVSRSFTAVTTDDTQEMDEASGTLRQGTCTLIHRCSAFISLARWLQFC